jgi:hypothetical protein
LSANFSLRDIEACLVSGALFSLFALIPGFAIAWLSDLLAFRKRTFLAQVTISIPLSIGLTPALAYLLGRFLSMTAIWVVFGSLWLIFAVLLVRKILTTTGIDIGKLPVAHIAIVCGWLAVGLFSLIDLQIKDRLYYSVVSYDYSLRTAIVSSISRTGIPPANPYFFPGHGIPLRYHYFWLIPCSLVNLLGGSWVSARQAIIGGTLWCGVGLIAIVPLYLRFFHPEGARRIYARSLTGIGLLAVTGLDVIPNLLRDLAGLPLPDPEWWNNSQISSWTTSVLWVPHHTAAMIAGLMAILILWNSVGVKSAWRRGLHMLLGGLSMAACLGSSIYVGFVFGSALLVWTGILFLKRWYREAVFAVAVGSIAILAVARHALDLRGNLSGAPGSGAVFQFLVTDFVFSGMFRAWIHGSVLRLNVVNGLLLPVNYFLELGAFLAAGVWTVHHWLTDSKKLSRYQMATLTFGATSFLICTFLRSSVIANNDLGSRGFLLAQFVLLLWMTDILQREIPLSVGWRRLLGVLLVIGLVSSLHEVVVLRMYPIASDLLDIPRQDWLCPDHNLGKRTYALRESYEQLRTALPANAIVQHNPNRTFGDLPYGLYADRQAAADTPACGVVFGGDPKACTEMLARLNPIFEGVSGGDEVDRACADLSISAILVKDTDPAWANRVSWVWHRQPIAANEYVRAIPCIGQGTGEDGLVVARGH